MENNKLMCPLLNFIEINDDECYETCLVSVGLLKKEAINNQFTKKENFKEICINCKNHNLD